MNGKVQNAIRMQMILAGLAVSLFFTGTVRAQEIYNTEFNNSPNAVPFVQPTPAQPSNSATTSAALTAPQAMKAANSLAASATQEAPIAPSKSTKVWIATTLLLCVGLFVFSAWTASDDDLNPRNSLRARSMPLA